MDQKTAKRIRLAGWILFFVYLTLLLYFLFFYEEYGRRAGQQAFRYNLTPLREIRRFVGALETLGMRAVFMNLAGNVIGFMPFGAILPVLSKRMRTAWKMILISLLLSVGIELVQLFTGVGVCDIDDVILNTLGGVCGYWCFLGVNRLRRKWYG